jgi:hypothetical protein
MDTEGKNRLRTGLAMVVGGAILLLLLNITARSQTVEGMVWNYTEMSPVAGAYLRIEGGLDVEREWTRTTQMGYYRLEGLAEGLEQEVVIWVPAKLGTAKVTRQTVWGYQTLEIINWEVW